jgi:hypothetical protein
VLDFWGIFVYGVIPSVAVDPFLTISAKDIGFVEIEIGIEVVVGIEVGIEVGVFPAIFCIWVDI